MYVGGGGVMNVWTWRSGTTVFESEGETRKLLPNQDKAARSRDKKSHMSVCLVHDSEEGGIWPLDGYIRLEVQAAGQGNRLDSLGCGTVHHSHTPELSNFKFKMIVDFLLDRYKPGYVEVMGSVYVQVVYLLFGLIMERLRPRYRSETTPKMIVECFRNHVVATAMHFGYVAYRAGQPVLSWDIPRPYALPSWQTMARDVIIALFIRDVLFWFIHRLWHLPGVYELIHAKHHELKDPTTHHVFTISYMSLVDFILLYGSLVVAIAKGMDMDIATALTFAFVSAVGEQVKLVWGDEAHDEHHLDGSANFGVYGFMDWVFGTNSRGFLPDSSLRWA